MANSKAKAGRTNAKPSKPSKPSKSSKKSFRISKPQEGKDSGISIVKGFAKPVKGLKKPPASGGEPALRTDFEKEVKKLKIKLDSSLQENTELVNTIEQLRLDSRNLRSKLINLGVDISSVREDEDGAAPEESETIESIRLLEWKLATIVPDIKALGVRKQLFLHYKGGTGKTSLSVSYGYKLAKLGFKVLMIDADPLGHLTEFFKIQNREVKDSLYDVLINGADISGSVTKTKTDNLHVIPSSISLSAIELPLASLPMPGERLRLAISRIEGDYDFIIIDSAPNIGFLSLNAILTSDDILIPVLADYLSYYGLKVLFEILASIEKDFSFTFGNVCVLLNRFNEFQKVSFDAKTALETHYADYLLKSVIHESAEMANATGDSKTVFESNALSRGAEDILKLIFEVLFYIGGKKW